MMYIIYNNLYYIVYYIIISDLCYIELYNYI
uniref:Uncharacterized protein n=1 Tax=Herelleviridae sp. cttEB8 TaxID=2825832 RepID=A0A8S5P7F3_9CAUD|nr:MAG TPA: hypothetical protein [Herelleviridae sp. cttEB8]